MPMARAMRCTCGVLILLWLSSCQPAGPTAVEAAAAGFRSFQDALFARDATRLRSLVCADAREAIPGLLQADLTTRQPLTISHVTRQDYEFRIHVRDPNRPATGEDAFYIVTKEDGQMRVDLISTARYQSRTTHRKLARPTLVPNGMGPQAVEAAARRAAAHDAGR